MGPGPDWLLRRIVAGMTCAGLTAPGAAVASTSRPAAGSRAVTSSTAPYVPLDRPGPPLDVPPRVAAGRVVL